MAETLARVHTHTHTQGDLINKKEISIKYALLMIDRKDRWIFYLSFLRLNLLLDFLIYI